MVKKKESVLVDFIPRLSGFSIPNAATFISQNWPFSRLFLNIFYDETRNQKIKAQDLKFNFVTFFNFLHRKMFPRKLAILIGTPDSLPTFWG